MNKINEAIEETTEPPAMKKILVRKLGSVRLTARCSNYCCGNCCRL